LPIRRGLIGHYAVFQSSRCKAVAILNEDVARELQSQLRNPVIIFPDVTDESKPDVDFLVAQQIRDKARGRKVIGLLGSLNKRKGFMTLLEVSQKAIKEDWFFVFIGSFSEHSFDSEDLMKINSNLQEPPPNCFFYFNFVPDGSSFNALVNQCDILFAAYENFPYSSNLLTKAAVFQKPILVSENFCMGQRVEKFKLGVSIPEGNVLDCFNALRYLSQNLESNTDQPQPDFEEYKYLHSDKKLFSVFSSILRNL
jgi:glycosyltransferase involved in cell wall biosynthesis